MSGCPLGKMVVGEFADGLVGRWLRVWMERQFCSICKNTIINNTICNTVSAKSKTFPNSCTNFTTNLCLYRLNMFK